MRLAALFGPRKPTRSMTEGSTRTALPKSFKGVSPKRDGSSLPKSMLVSGARHASPLFVLLAEEEDDKGEEVGWAGQMGWPAGPLEEARPTLPALEFAVAAAATAAWGSRLVVNGG